MGPYLPVDDIPLGRPKATVVPYLCDVKVGQTGAAYIFVGEYAVYPGRDDCDVTERSGHSIPEMIGFDWFFDVFPALVNHSVKAWQCCWQRRTIRVFSILAADKDRGSEPLREPKSCMEGYQFEAVLTGK